MRKIINKQLENYKSKDVGLLFSGGMDSLSLLLSCLDIGIRPNLYTFRLKSYYSEDYLKSVHISRIFNLNLNVTIIDDEDIERLIKDIKYIIKEFKVKKKTQIQCIHPFLHMVNNVSNENILSGLCADDLYGSSRKMQELGRLNQNEFDNKRRDLFLNPESSSFKYIKYIFESNNIKFIAPYKDNINLFNYFINKSFKELHSPKQKMVMYESYKYELEKYDLYRRNSNLQCNSKLREFHDKLLNTKENTNHNKSVVAIYNRYYKEIWG